MDHLEARERLEAFVIGALDAAEVEMVTDHLRTCDECRAELADLRRVADGLPAALEVTSPLRVHPSVKRRVLAAIQRPSRSRHSRLAIARLTGYESEVSVSKAFRRYFGVSPGAYRRSGAPNS
jgi:anti-sigma factor RsiW